MGADERGESAAGNAVGSTESVLAVWMCAYGREMEVAAPLIQIKGVKLEGVVVSGGEARTSSDLLPLHALAHKAFRVSAFNSADEWAVSEAKGGGKGIDGAGGAFAALKGTLEIELACVFAKLDNAIKHLLSVQLLQALCF